MKRWIQCFIDLGIRSHGDPHQNKIIRLINKICLLVILAIIPYMLLTLYFGSLLATFVQLAAIIVLCLVLYFKNESTRLEQSFIISNNELLILSETDPMTQLHNRRSFGKIIDKEWGRGLQTKNPLAVIMIDVDHFKRFNDHYGHQEGDHCLVSIAGVISKTTREFSDFPARFGGKAKEKGRNRLESGMNPKNV